MQDYSISLKTTFSLAILLLLVGKEWNWNFTVTIRNREYILEINTVSVNYKNSVIY